MVVLCMQIIGKNCPPKHDALALYVTNCIINENQF